MARFASNSEHDWEIWHEDCVATCDRLQGYSCNLIYFDPPFGTGKIWRGRGEQAYASFADMGFGATSLGSNIAGSAVAMSRHFTELLDYLEAFGVSPNAERYLSYMAERVAPLYRVLAENGSIFLHCDSHSSHYLRLLMDCIFGARGFRNELIWKRTSSHNNADKWAPIHDTILVYSKAHHSGFEPIFNQVYRPYNRQYLEDNYRYADKAGQYAVTQLTGPGRTEGESGRPWRGISPGDRHWAIPRRNWSRASEVPAGTFAALDWLDSIGRLHWHDKLRKKMPGFKRYLTDLTSDIGIPLHDVIDDIPPVRGEDSTGYPTEKPVKLLERIILSASNEGDIFYDPFMGSGTSLVAAVQLGRKAIGSDISVAACRLAEKRLADISRQGRLFHGTDRKLS